jgi:hypothetical protein
MVPFPHFFVESDQLEPAATHHMQESTYEGAVDYAKHCAERMATDRTIFVSICIKNLSNIILSI